MHPAPSVILFTVASGLGFGCLAFLGLGLPPVTGWVAFAFYALAYLFACGGLMASTFHLGHPERAWRAFSQWRTSWLSREAVLAVAALVIMAIHGAGVVFFGVRLTLIGALGSLLAVATILATAMIYTQLRTVPRWHHWSTPVLFLALSLSGGALLAGQPRVAAVLLIATGALQAFVWHTGAARLVASGTTLATATGLGVGVGGRVRLFEPPHTGGNYLTKEMAFRVGRKHAQQLRLIALVLGFALPAMLLLLPFAHWLAAVALISHVAGVLAQRWLFFAEAEHVVSLYYGQ